MGGIGILYLIVCITYILVFALGISIRFGLHLHPDSQGLYIAEYLFVVLSVSTMSINDRNVIY